MSRRVFTACLGTETNSFSPIPTGMSVFASTMLVRGGAHDPRHPSLFALPLLVWRDRARARGWTVIEGLAAFATPAGDTTRATYEALRDELLGDLRRALPVDAVLLNLHGAMIAEGYPDAEGDLLAKVRECVGASVPIGAELDLHCHLTELKVASADILVTYKEYPHIDVSQRAVEVFDLVARMLDDGLRPARGLYDCAMLAAYPTTREPMVDMVAMMQAMEREPGVLSVSLAHGFPWGDTPEVGTRVLVITDDDPALAQTRAREFGEAIWNARFAIRMECLSIDEALDQAVAVPAGEGPCVLADIADNPGGGAAGDSTFVLRRLLERGIGGAAISPLWDPVATGLAFDAGEGARFDLRIGGKLGPSSGAPVDATVTVMGLKRDGWQPFGESMAPLGRMAWVRIGGGDAAIDLVLNDVRTQAFAPACFSEVGIDPSGCRMLIVKSTQHFHAAFAPIARAILYVSAPGTVSTDMTLLPYRSVNRFLWPRVENPFDSATR